MNSNFWKKYGIYALIVLIFLVLSYAFTPEVLSGKIVNQRDISGWKGAANETIEWNKAHPDDKTAWTDSMFGGMPNVTFIDDFSGDWTKPLYKLMLIGKRPASYLFIALLGAFLMMLAMGIRPLLAAMGAVAVAFCSYNFQIIQVGHNTKMQAIAFAPYVLAALLYTYNKALKIRDKEQGKKWLLPCLSGSALFALALSFQIKANHVQITYYLALVILLYAIASLIWVILKKNRQLWIRFLSASGLLLCFGLAGIGTNADKLVPTYAYTPFTMRGGSELSGEGNNAKGLDLDYATAWSYGLEETPNLLIPDFNGGSSSGSLGPDSATYKLFKQAGQNAKSVCKSLPLYWGPQPFTAGPMYIGAISIFLFMLGLFVLDDRHKWWLLVASLLALMLGWGRNFMWFTELWFKYAPMYNKFRTVSMALTILQYTVPLLGVYTLERIMRQDIEGRKVVRGVWISFLLTGGFCALTALMPGIAGDFVAASDSQMHELIAESLRLDRISLLKADAWRSFLLITVSAALILFAYFKNDKSYTEKFLRISSVVICLLVLFDMWSVGKRYLNHEHFISPKDFNAQFDLREADKYILEDSDPSYRVLDLSCNTFNSSVSSFRHKSIGGYSPTKMQRYQDLIDRFLNKEISSLYLALQDASSLDEMEEKLPDMPIMNMLNARYVIISGDYPPLVNDRAYGTAWFASEAVAAATADEEILLLGSIDTHSQAVIRTDRFPEAASYSAEAQGCIKMTSYAPNRVEYEYEADADALVLFSEIYHPSWKASVKLDDQTQNHAQARPLELVQANWVLRAAILPAGSGKVVMSYEPSDYTLGSTISLICSILLLLALLTPLAAWLISCKKQGGTTVSTR